MTNSSKATKTLTQTSTKKTRLKHDLNCTQGRINLCILSHVKFQYFCYARTYLSSRLPCAADTNVLWSLGPHRNGPPPPPWGLRAPVPQSARVTAAVGPGAVRRESRKNTNHKEKPQITKILKMQRLTGKLNTD